MFVHGLHSLFSTQAGGGAAEFAKLATSLLTGSEYAYAERYCHDGGGGWVVGIG